MILSKAIEVLGPIDILVSNPSMNRRAPFLDADPQTFEKILAATLTAGFHMSQLFARHRVAEAAGGISFSSEAFTPTCPTRRARRTTPPKAAS
jgi:NAD(P)-dependent dehydrogenase (short-subunit alcohol dehydrogenase family)